MNRFMRQAAALLAAGLFSLAAAAQEGQPCPRPGTQQELPQTLGPGFERAGTHSFEAEMPGGGCSVRYKHPSGMWADVYIYQAKLGTIEDKPRDERLLSEFQTAMAGIRYSWEERQQAKVSDLAGRYEKRGQQDVEVMVGTASIDSPKHGALSTYLQVWSGGGSIWKLRTTYPAADKAVSDSAVVALGNALVDLSREKP